jgi:cell division transport system permease protein
MIWLRRHGFAIQQAFRKLTATPFANLATLLVLGLVCALPLTIWLMASSLIAVADRASEQTTLNVYLKLTATTADLQTLTQQAASAPSIATAKAVPREQAMSDLAKRPDLAGLTSGLDTNPLPHVIIIQSNKRAAAQIISQQLAQDPRVERVFADWEWSDKLASIGQFARRIALALTAATTLALAMVIINTVRLQVASQRAEIEVSRLIGATASHVRRPFLYFGLLQGLLGGLIGYGLASALAFWLRGEVQAVGGLFGNVLNGLLKSADQMQSSHATFPSWAIFLITVSCTALAGLLSAHRAAR